MPWHIHRDKQIARESVWGREENIEQLWQEI